jgi:hypothetical protein
LEVRARHLDQKRGVRQGATGTVATNLWSVNQVVTHRSRGHRNLADHLLRSAPLLVDGANRRGAASERQRFTERGECAEVAAAGDLLLAMDIGPRQDGEKLKGLVSRDSAMWTGLAERLR